MKHQLVILVLSAGILAACNKTVPPVQRAVGRKDTTAPTNLADKRVNSLIPIDRPILVQSVHLSDHLGSGGFVDSDVAQIKTGSRIYLSMIFKQAPLGSAARVVWMDAKGKAIGEERRQLETGAKNVTFEAPKAAKWKAGKYSAQAWMGGEDSDEKSFVLVKGK